LGQPLGRGASFVPCPSVPPAGPSGPLDRRLRLV
jgi:hypothetical protein